MRIAADLLKLCLCLLLILSASAVQAMEVNINFLLANKSLDSDDWGDPAIGEDADSQPAFGIATTFGGKDWPVAIALDQITSARYDTVRVSLPLPAEVDLVQGTWELDAGVRKIWKKGKARPFVGGGLGIIAARQEKHALGLLTMDDTDSTVGLWFNGGAFWRLGKRFNIGVDLRLSAGEVTLFGEDVKAGGGTLGLLLGWGWGGGGD